MATIAATSAKKIPAGKTPVSAELLSKMQQHYHRLAKKHPLWSAERLRTATGGFFGVEFINDEEPNAD